MPPLHARNVGVPRFVLIPRNIGYVNTAAHIPPTRGVWVITLRYSTRPAHSFIKRLCSDDVGQVFGPGSSSYVTAPCQHIHEQAPALLQDRQAFSTDSSYPNKVRQLVDLGIQLDVRPDPCAMG